jgi:hypothetical protein
MEYTEVMHKGDDSGNEMLVRFRLPSGLEIFGLPTKNFYGGDWDLGPTWNYAVLSDKPFLRQTVSSGRRPVRTGQKTGRNDGNNWHQRRRP